MKTIIIVFVFMNFHTSYAQWELVNLEVTGGEILFINDNTGFLVGTLLFKTTNQGLSWDSISIPSVGSMLDISFPNQLTGYICANSGGRFLKTIDGGTTWTLMYTNVANFGQYSIDFYDANTGFIVGSGGGNPSSISIIKTTNGGINWFVQLHSAAYLNKVKMINSQEVIACGNRVYKTNNGGVNWNEISFPNTFEFWNVDFKNNIGYMVGESIIMPPVYRTSDYGETWQATQLSTVGLRLLGVHFLNDSYGFVCGYGGIYRTSNSGQNWTRDTLLLTFSIDGNSNYLFAAGFQGLYRTSNPIGIIQISNEVPNFFKLQQNYPNPFNPVTSIKFDIVSNAYVKLTVFDILGHEVITLVNQKLQTGSYKVDWDATNYPSGLYFYKLETNDFAETKKMILIK